MSKTIAYDYCFNCADIPYNDEIIDGTSVMISFVAYNALFKEINLSDAMRTVEGYGISDLIKVSFDNENEYTIQYLIYWIIYLMCSEVFMMESIVGAIIGAGGAILVGILGLIGTCIYNGRKTKKLNDNLLKLQDSYIGVKDGEMSLSKQIGVISGTDSSLSNQHKDIEKFLKEDIEFKLKQTMTYSSDAYRLIETERQLREQREKLLNCDESKLSQAIDDISAFKNLWVEKNYRIQQLSEQVIQLQEERQSLERTINEKNNEINKLKEQIEKYRYSRDDKQTLYR